jgi:hypothetical protein
VYNPKRGDQVLVSPNVSGPAAGRPGCASGAKADGHYEILDRHPSLHGAQLIGWFDADDLLPRLAPAIPAATIQGALSPAEYLDIADHWVATLGGKPDEASRKAALLWALERGVRTGRVAWQFARDWVGRKKK